MHIKGRMWTGLLPSICALQRHIPQPLTPVFEERKPSLAKSFTPHGSLVMCYSETDLKIHLNNETPEILPVVTDHP